MALFNLKCCQPAALVNYGARKQETSKLMEGNMSYLRIPVRHLMSCAHAGSKRNKRAIRKSALLVAAGIVLSSIGAEAGCNSGNTGTLLTSASCQGSAPDFAGLAVGLGTNASGQESVALGTGAQATGFGGVAAGWHAIAGGNWTVAVGQQANAGGNRSTVIGFQAGNVDPVAGATAVGSHAGATGIFSVAIGADPVKAAGNYSIAIGGGDGVGGNPPLTDNSFGVAIGTGTEAIGVRTVSVGAFAGDNAGSAVNNRNSNFGTEAGRFVTGGGNTATGLAAGNNVKGDLNSALGNSAGVQVTGNNNTAAGVLAGVNVKGSSNSAHGDNAGRNVAGSNNVAVGKNAGINLAANNTVAVGAFARATATQSTAIGFGSAATAAHTVSVGTSTVRRRIVNVAPGVSPNDAVNVAQLQAALSATAPVTASTKPSDNASLEAVRRELIALRATIERQQKEIDELRQQREAALLQ